MRLSNMSFSSSTMSSMNSTVNETDDIDFTFPNVADPFPLELAEAGENLFLSQSALASAEYPALYTSSTSSPRTPTRTPSRSDASAPRLFQLFNLPLLRQEYESSDSLLTPTASHHSVDTSMAGSPSMPNIPGSHSSPRVHWHDRAHLSGPSLSRKRSETGTSPTSTSTVTKLYTPPTPSQPIHSSPLTENTPLLRRSASSASFSPPFISPLPPWYTSQAPDPPLKPRPSASFHGLLTHATQAVKALPGGAANILGQFTVQSALNKIPYIVDVVPYVMKTAVKSIPAVLLGCLLNILDGVSCKFHPNY